MNAERAQTIAVVVIVVLTLGAVVFAYLAGHGAIGFSASTGAAKPLTTDKPRDITMPIARSEDANTPDFDAEDLARYEGNTKETKMLLADHRLREKLASNEGARAAQEAFAQLEPDQGVALLLERLSGIEDAAAATAVYQALGTLYLQTDPPRPDLAITSLREAQRLAQTPEAADEALLAEIKLLREQSGWSEAGPRLGEAFPQEAKATPAGLELAVLLGRYYQDTGDTAAAERVYKQAVGQALEARAEFGQEAEDVYRQLCMELARLYRRSGRPDDADALVRDMRRRLDVAPTPPAK